MGGTPADANQRKFRSSHAQDGATPWLSRGSDAQGPAPARQASLRGHNLSLVLQLILDAPLSTSRASVAKTTGLTRGTVSALVDTLIEARLVTESEPVESTRTGRRAVPIVTAEGTVAAIGAEINVDYMAVRVLDLSGRNLGERYLPIVEHGTAEEALDMLVTLMEPLRTQLLAAKIAIAGLTIALPGLVETATNILRIAPNLGWHEVDAIRALRVYDQWATTPITVGNEADLAALAEAEFLRRSTGQPQSFVYVSGKIGIGSATVMRGQLFVGRHGWTGEIGHILIDEQGPPCQCGATGCLELYAGESAILAACGLGAEEGIDKVAELAKENDEQTLAALERAGRALGAALANVLNVVDVDVVVLGGIYESLVPWLEPQVVHQLNLRVLAAPYASIAVVASVCGHLPAVQGAALSSLATIRENPLAWI